MKDFFKRIEGKNVIVIGDVMIDAYMWGDVNRISPEAPVPIVSVTKRENRLGGAANVALNLKSLGVNPIICSVIGQDESGAVYSDLMKENNLPIEGLVMSTTRKTTRKTRVISGGQQLLRVDDEISYPLIPEIENKLIETIAQVIEQKEISAIVFEDYDKGVISKNLISKITQLATEQNIPTTVDPKNNNYNYYENVTLFKPNFKEFKEGGKLDIYKADFDSIFKHAKAMIDDRNIKYVFVTLSELGVFICDKNEYHIIPAEYRQIADVSGAGDTVISIATLLLSEDVDMKTIAKISNFAGGIVCEKVGVVSIGQEDLKDLEL